MADRDVRKDLIIEAARLYYIEGLSQQEVGKRLNMVRSNVSKLLKRAGELGIVEIRIVEPSTPMVQLEFGLKERFELREVHVVMTERTYDKTLVSVGKQAAHADIAFLGIGTPEPQYSALVRAGYITDEQSEELNRSGAEGMICGYFFDIDGTPIDSVLNRRVVSIDLERLKTIPQRVAVAAGERKAIALLGAIRSGYVNGLVVDESAARQLLQASG